MHYMLRDPDALHGLFQAVKALDNAVSYHEAWLSNLYRAIVCNELRDDTADVHEDAHHHCRFGQWYDRVGDDLLTGHASFERIGAVHRQMHDAARKVLVDRAAEGVSGERYDAFTGLSIAFKLEIRNLQFDLLSRLCTVDHLTGVWNRHSMHFRLTQEMERVVRIGRTSCIAIMDVDHFKAVNDGYGHVAGDQVLRNIASFFAQRIRKYDVLFRYGGEEFLICLSDIDIEAAVASMDRLRAALSREPIALPDGRQVQVTVSMGIATLAGSKQIDSVIQEADHALLCAKARGRNRTCAWGDE
jgi:diguanylate cyclase